MDKSNVTSSFQEILDGLYFFATFFFSLSLSIGKRSTLAKIWEGREGLQSPPAPPVSAGLLSQLFSNLFEKNFPGIKKELVFKVVVAKT